MDLTKSLVLCTALLMSSVALAQIYCSTTKHPGDTRLWIESSIVSFESGNSLLSACEDPNQAPRCGGYVAGAADVLAEQNTSKICRPVEVSIQQLADVVKKYLTDHPETRHYAATVQIFAALRAAFPCPTK